MDELYNVEKSRSGVFDLLCSETDFMFYKHSDEMAFLWGEDRKVIHHFHLSAASLQKNV